MKKITMVSAISLALLIAVPTVLAQGGQQGQGGTQQGQGGQQQAVAPGTGTGAGAGAGTGVGTGTGNRGIGTAVQNLTRVAERANNPGIGEQVRAMAQNHVQVQARTNTALNEMGQRNQAFKFLVGPDYKNAGQVRSDVVGLRNDIRKLELLQDGASVEDIGDIQGAMDELEIEATDLEAQLAEQLDGFSLFGWLAKLLAN